MNPSYSDRLARAVDNLLRDDTLTVPKAAAAAHELGVSLESVSLRDLREVFRTAVEPMNAALQTVPRTKRDIAVIVEAAATVSRLEAISRGELLIPGANGSPLPGGELLAAWGSLTLDQKRTELLKMIRLDGSHTSLCYNGLSRADLLGLIQEVHLEATGAPIIVPEVLERWMRDPRFLQAPADGYQIVARVHVPASFNLNRREQEALGLGTVSFEDLAVMVSLGLLNGRDLTARNIVRAESGAVVVHEGALFDYSRDDNYLNRFRLKNVGAAARVPQPQAE